MIILLILRVYTKTLIGLQRKRVIKEEILKLLHALVHLFRFQFFKAFLYFFWAK